MSVLTFGVQVVEVAVDIETGEVRVERVAAAHDVGRIINPLGARSQVEGGIIQGVGHTLSEQRLHDPETGRILTTSLDAAYLSGLTLLPGGIVLTLGALAIEPGAAPVGEPTPMSTAAGSVSG